MLCLQVEYAFLKSKHLQELEIIKVINNKDINPKHVHCDTGHAKGKIIPGGKNSSDQKMPRRWVST